MTEETMTEGIADTEPTAPEGAEYWGEEPNTQEVEDPLASLEPLDANLVAPKEEQVTSEPKETDQQRYQYWQSRYDQKASEIDAMSKKLDEYEKIAPIAEYIQDNPDILKGVARSLSGDNPQVPSNEKSADLPKKPERPTKPMNYDPSEAYMDTESDSYKYRVAIDDYRDAMIDYQEKSDNYRIQQMEAREQQVLKQRQDMEAKKAQEDMVGQLVNEYGYSADKAQEFMQFYSSPESITLDNLVALDRFRNSPSQQEVETQQRVQAMQNQQKRMAIPTPTAIKSGETTPNLSDEDMFNLALMNNKR